MQAMHPTLPSTVDLTPFLPQGWAEDLEKFAATSLFPVQQDEGGPGSIGYGADAGIEYRTALKPEITEGIPWVAYLHEQVIPVLLGLQGYGGLAGDPRADGELTPIQGSHGLVVNVFTKGKKGIEWHRDGADVFLNVIVSTRVWDRATGGRLLVHDGREVQALALGAPGKGVVVLTGDYPHTVEPLAYDTAHRVTLLFSYTNPARAAWREDRYNDHFYAGREA
jgi:hypothetical protein